VFLPANCKETLSYLVLYLLHGVGDNEYSWEVNGKSSAILNELVEDEQIDPVIVVMPFGFIKQDLKLKRQFPAKGDFAQYFSDVVKMIENEYKEIDSKRRALAGLSMGGKQALEYALDTSICLKRWGRSARPFTLGNLGTRSQMCRLSSAPKQLI
jgi:enterochelin esterase-like enzyme